MLLIGSGIYQEEKKATASLDQMYKYTYSSNGGEWEALGNFEPKIEAQEEFGVYMVKNNENSNAAAFLSECYSNP